MSIGLDIGEKTVKLVELIPKGGKLSLKSAGATGHRSGPVEKQAGDKELSDFAQVIKKLFHDSKAGSRDVSVSLPESQVYTRIVKFPLLNENEIASAVKYEAEEYIPIPLQDAVVEHQILERREQGNPPQVLVLLIAVNRTVVDKYVKLCNMAGLNVKGVESAPIAMTRSLAPDSSTVLIVDFGSGSTDVAIAKNSQLYLTRSLSTAGNAFTRAVAQSLGVSLAQAEEYKKTYGLSQDQLEGKVGQALIPVLRVVVEEIKKAMYYYQSEFKNEPPSSVILSGGSAGIPGLSSMLARMLGGEVIIGNPFARVQVDEESASALANYAPLYSTAVGLAMRQD